MLKSIVEFGLTRRLTVILGLVAFIIFGAFSFARLNIEAYPNPAPVILEISAQAPGLSAEEMEKYYTIPMETSLYATPKVTNIRSTSFYGLSFVRVTFEYGVDPHLAYVQTSTSIQQRLSLPNGLVPTIQQSSLVGEIVRYQVIGPPNFGLTNLRTIQDWVVARRLLTIPGVVQINSWGGLTKQFAIEVDQGKLEAHNVTLPQVVTALANSNLNVGGREIELGEQSVNIRGVGLIDDGGDGDVTKGFRTDDIENIVLGQVNGVPVQIKDVARVTVGAAPRLGVLGRDREDDVVAAIVVMGRAQHTNDILPRVEQEIDRINASKLLPPGVRLEPYYDRGALVGVTTHTVLHNLVFGCILVFLIQWIFIGDLRSALIVAANIPLALLFAIAILVAREEDANLLSMGAVDFGIIVDSGVILIENIFRNFQSQPFERARLLKLFAQGYWGPDKTRAPGARKVWNDRLRLIFISAMEVDKAVFFTGAITVTAFLPLFTMTGVEGQIFGPMARTYAYALIGALVATFTVTPVLSAVLLPVHIEETETLIVRRIRSIYNPALRWAISHRLAVLGVGAAFLSLSGLVASRLGAEFLPALEEGSYWIRANLPPTTSLRVGEAATSKMREILLNHPEIVTVISQHGRPDNGSEASSFAEVQLFAPLKPMDEWPSGLTKETLTKELDKELRAALPGVLFNFSQPIQDNINEAVSGVRGANSIKIVGPDLETLERIADQVMEQLRLVEGIADLAVLHTLGQPNLNIKIDRAKAGRYGLTAADINSVIQAAIGGAPATAVLEGDRQFQAVVRLAPTYRGSIEAIENVKVAAQASANAQNFYIPLKEVAQISLDTGASFVYREQSQRFVPVKFSVRDRDLASAISEAQQRIAQHVPLPVGYQILWAGEFGSLEQAKKRLAVVVPLSFLLIFALLYSLFNSFRESLVALAGIPFAIGGGVIALYVADLPLSVSAAIGFVSLFGVAVMDGILNITYWKELSNQGMGFIEAVTYAAEQRMRPMLMMALSAGVGLLPAALSHAIGSQVQRPLATVVVGGMFIGPALLLLVGPVLRSIFLIPPAPPAEIIEGGGDFSEGAQDQ
ncbi:CusA/CzcA family heavy metal efflux RND transporter [Methylocystis sp. B8]|uniref:efflux RND transporter permease subunit n=1 Tax=Methylocystis sp. B8 TaxID=544938 RepID=UPI0010FE3605|nr:CusA/CzcA family heavy metal efflux RND transporter [Methylocystis sp. B8]TLG72210.1 efflux RND transporter permease subunit [Methylocystis sp. B8]